VTRSREGVTRHAGSPIPADTIFFAAPPPEIGWVISAESTLRSSEQAMSQEKRLIISLLSGLAVALLIWGMSRSIFWTVVLGISVGLLVHACIRFHHRCSYVGEQGIIEFWISGSPSTKPKERSLYFRDATNLYTYKVRRYYNRVYTGTDYVYKWTKTSGNTHQLSGGYRAENSLPKENNSWYFANSAEAAWSNHLLKDLNDQLNRFGYIEFPIQGNPKAVRIGIDFLEFVSKNDTTQRATVADMKDIRLSSGLFQFKHKDSKWWSGKGKYSFRYDNIPNARLFLLCLKQLTGIQCT
jgi:hypothetical protein